MKKKNNSQLKNLNVAQISHRNAQLLMFNSNHCVYVACFSHCNHIRNLSPAKKF